MPFRIVHDYYRQELFDFFRPYASPFWAVTFELEVTRLLDALRRRQYPTYLNLCYLFTRAAQELEDFRYRLRGDEIVLHERLDFGLTVPAPGGRFSFSYYDFEPDFERFNRLSGEREEPEGPNLHEEGDRAWLFFSALPKVAFTGLTHASRGPEDAEPRISFGRFAPRHDRTFVPVGLQVNHRFVDGAAVGELAERAQAEYDGLG